MSKKNAIAPKAAKKPTATPPEKPMNYPAGTKATPKAKDPDLKTFAFRLTKDESAAIHKAAGPGKASQFARSLLTAVATGDSKSLQQILEAVKTRK